MKTLNKKYIAMLLLLSVGQSSYIRSSFNAASSESCSDSESYLDAGSEFSPETFQSVGRSLREESNFYPQANSYSESDNDSDTQYSFIESQDGCMINQNNQDERQDLGYFVDINPEEEEEEEEDDDDQDDENQESIKMVFNTTTPENITEFDNNAFILEDEKLRDFTPSEVGSEHERRSVGSQIINEAQRDLRKSNFKLNKVENQIKELTQRSEKAITNSAQYLKEQLNEDRIQENFDIATAKFSTAIKQIDVLAKSTDKVIQKEFKASQDSLMKNLEKTEQKLRKVSNKMDQQFKKLGKSTQRLFKNK